MHYNDPAVRTAELNISEAIRETFGDESAEYHTYRYIDIWEGGPDLYVFLSEHPSPRTGAQLHEGASFEVARLKGDIGSQNYELPADLDLSKFRSVAIYCKRFNVMFGSAQLITPP